MAEVKLYKRPSKALKLLALTVPFVLAGLWMINVETKGTFDYIVGWVSVCFFGLGIPIGIFHIFDRRPQIIINEDGIRDRTSKQGIIKWEQIKSAYSWNIHGQKFISLVLDEGFVIKGRQYKWATKISEVIGAQKVNLSLGQLKVDESKLTRFINKMSKTKPEGRIKVIENSFC